jgi:hypothetical protein
MIRPRLSGLLVAAILVGCAPVLTAASAVPSDPDPAFVAQAVESFVTEAAYRATTEEDLWTLAAAPLLEFWAHPDALGRLWVQEVAFSAGDGSLWRRAREEAAASGEGPRAAMARLVTELSRSDGRILVRAAARLFVTLEPESSPSRLRLADLEAGALDAAPPAALSVRHRSILPDGETDALVLAWPPDGGEGAAVVRYSDRALPPDVVFFGPGDRRAIPLSGVARVDFLVAGSDPGAPALRAPVDCVRDASALFSRLEARASAGPGGPRLTWTTASHAGLWGWAIFREEVLSDGRIARTGPELVPSSETALESFGYAYVDTSASPDTFYRYTVWAVTDEGLLARAFWATLETGRNRRD